MLSLRSLARSVINLSPPEGSENQALSQVWICSAFHTAGAEESDWGLLLNPVMFTRGCSGKPEDDSSGGGGRGRDTFGARADGRGAAMHFQDSHVLELCCLSGESAW